MTGAAQGGRAPSAPQSDPVRGRPGSARAPGGTSLARRNEGGTAP